ncbi:hypothetical protein P3H15_24235 [Rhodococcus sp. T2V]|uniref:hypothetical protein n=1 Tax=Rhodococcus sp. T2V TaxID=3034164 RepID=UPI0023E19F2D|nr:hypothetical protein [Rhodococcus sp. T2V]MDF3308129.1 hypothetical protein [Rhodococcus sp. T2V]
MGCFYAIELATTEPDGERFSDGKIVICTGMRRHGVDAVLAAGATGRIFNLGHGVLPDTDPGALTALVHSL